MKTLKKTLCLVLAVVMAVGVLVIPANAAEFTDADEITHDEAVAVLSGLGIVNGVGDGSFNPDGTFTRAQAAALLANVLLKPEYAAILDSSKAVFSDVPVTSGYNKYITWAVENDHIHGYPDGTFKPDKALTGTELAALMLEALGETIDASNYKNFVNLTAKDKGLLDGIKNYVPSDPISRDDAVQMMFNTMNKNTSSTSKWVVLEDGDADWDPGYESDTEANALLVAATLNASAAGAAQYTVKKVTTPVGSILSKTYKVSNTAWTVDDYQRPLSSWIDSNNKVLYAAPTDPVLEYTTPVTVKAIYTALGLSRTTTAVQYTDGTRRGSTFTLAANDGTVIPNSDYGVLTQVYENGKNSAGVMTYKITQIFPYYGVVSSVKDVTNPLTNVTKTTMTYSIKSNYHVGSGYTTTDFVDFAKNDHVMVSRADIGTTEEVWETEDVYTLDVIEGTLSKIVTKNGVTTYTVGGNDYIAWLANTALTSTTDYTVIRDQLSAANVGKNVRLYVDQYGYIVDVVAAETVEPNYILVLNAQSTSVSSGWASTPTNTTAQVYGILSDGTYGTYTVNYGSRIPGYLTTANAASPTTLVGKVYRYNTDANGNMLLYADNSAYAGPVVDGTTYAITNGTTGVAFNASTAFSVLNSETLFVYYTTDAVTGAINSLTTRLGNASCGNIPNGTAKVGNKNNGAAKVVFVNGDYNAVFNTTGMVFIDDVSINSTLELVNDTPQLVYHYTAYKSDGTTVDAISVIPVAERGIYNINSNNMLALDADGASITKLTGGLANGNTIVNGKVVDQYVDTLAVNETASVDASGNTVFGTAPETYRSYTSGTYVFCGDSEDVKGNTYWAIFKNNAFVAIWFYGD